MSNEIYMNRCFQLALLGSGNVAPNPMVGAVLVYNDRIISEGYHAKFGGPHAEVMALAPINDRKILEQATLYVSLEPCSHSGKTPPCTELIISKNIRKVVVAVEDPFPQVNGSGIKQLAEAGIEVSIGLLEEQAKRINRRFFTFHQNKRPYIILKWAQSPDGYIAPVAENKKGIVHWISNPVSQRLVHRWRSEEQAILAGRKTIEADNPQLNVRGIAGNDPVKIIIDPDLSLNESYTVFKSETPVIIFNLVKNSIAKNITYVKINNHGEMIKEILDFLYQYKIQSVLIEGGAFTINKFITGGCWDEARIFTGGKLLQNGTPAPAFSGILYEKHKIADDTLDIYFNPGAISL